MSDETQPYSVDNNTMPWTEFYVEELKAGIPMKPIFADPDTGMSVAKLRYRAGFTNAWHSHKCGHGMYVLERCTPRAGPADLEAACGQLLPFVVAAESCGKPH